MVNPCTISFPRPIWLIFSNEACAGSPGDYYTALKWGSCPDRANSALIIPSLSWGALERSKVRRFEGSGRFRARILRGRLVWIDMTLCGCYTLRAAFAAYVL